jgi:hypothetical protein
MIVKCERLYNENTKQFHPGPSNRELTIGNLYAVLEIDYCKTEVFYRMFDDDNYEFHFPRLIRSDEFCTGKIEAEGKLSQRSVAYEQGPSF